MNKRKAFSWLANAEGISYLLLLLIAMPLKYLWQEPWLNRQLGMAHGILFIAYIAAVLLMRKPFGWNSRQTMLALFLSLIPFGTFYVTSKMMSLGYAKNSVALKA